MTLASMSWPPLRDPRTWLVAGALALTVLALAVPRINLTRDAYDVLAVVDITTSMNTRDVTSGGKSVSRLEAAKASLRETLAKLPCRSRLGLGTGQKLLDVREFLLASREGNSLRCR